jgi:hypothetical protein
LDVISVFDNIVVFVIPFVPLVTSWSVMWHKEHFRNFSVRQRA